MFLKNNNNNNNNNMKVNNNNNNMKVNNNNLVAVIEVNDYHLELLPFWQMYLSDFNRNYLIFYPQSIHFRKKRGEIIGGTPGGLFETMIDPSNLRSLSEITGPVKTSQVNQLSGEFLLINTYLEPNATNYPLFIGLLDKFSSNFTKLIMVFHGYSPTILKESRLINIFKKYRQVFPVFLFPTFSRKVFGQYFLTLFPLTKLVDHHISYCLPINVGIIGTITPQRDYLHLIEIAKMVKANYKKPFLKFIIIGAHPPPQYNSYLQQIVNTIQICGISEYIEIHINVDSDKLNEYLTRLHYIAPLTKDIQYLYTTLTGSIPLAISQNIPLIISRQLAIIYGLVDQVVYQNSLMEVINYIINLSQNDYRKKQDSLLQVYHNYNIKNRETFKNIMFK